MAAIGPVHSSPRLGVGFLRSHPAHLIALGLGTGLLRPGPGTCATAASWLAFVGLGRTLELSQAAQLMIGAAGLVIGTWAARRTGTDLGRPDAGQIVIDEIVAFWWVLTLLPRAAEAWQLQAAAFLLFRLFDILKPEPISSLERRMPNAWGVMLDDLVAGAYVWLVIELWIRLP
jgi:phosphatidylglycerophosphatase A